MQILMFISLCAQSFISPGAVVVINHEPYNMSFGDLVMYKSFKSNPAAMAALLRWLTALVGKTEIDRLISDYGKNVFTHATTSTWQRSSSSTMTCEQTCSTR